MYKAEFCIFSPQNYVIEHRKTLDKFEVLMHHTYAKRGCVVGIIDFYDLSVFQNFAFFGLIQAEQHRHKRGFSGAVFTKKGVNFPAF